MKKIIIKSIIVIASIFISLSSVQAFSTEIANEPVDINKKSKLTLEYNYGEYLFDEIDIEVHKIATMNESFLYTLTSEFEGYSIKLNGIKTNDEWLVLKNTLESYIIADEITPLSINKVYNNKIELSDLEPGLYLIKTKTIEEEKYILKFDTVLINVPELKEDGTWNYEIVAKPKASEFTPIYEEVTYKVIKEWKDNEKNRPKEVQVEIYQNGDIIENIKLSKENNWTYSWIALDDGSTWNVVERNVPKNYTVSILNKERNFYVINTSKEKNPKTSDSVYLYMYLFMGSISGIVLLLLALSIKKNKN